MKFSMQKWILFGSTLAATFGIWACGSSSSSVEDTLLTRTRVADYRQWHRVNPTPILVSRAFAGSCSISVDTAFLPDPHENTYITVYVNDTGKQTMLTQANPTFPVGTVIVKQKSSSVQGDRVQLLTVMEKQKAGFNPQNGDWDYAVLSGDAAQIQAHGKLPKCQGCHALVKDQDYTNRYAYLPAEVSSRLQGGYKAE